jgi:hypothetical protein
MPAILDVAENVYNEDGSPVIDSKTGKQVRRVKKVVVIRSWQKADGAQLYFHSNGTYGYKDGSPVRTRAELEDPGLIGNEEQRKLALVWWDRKGVDESKKYYASQAERSRLVAERSPGVMRQVDSDLDIIMYMRRPLADRRRAAFGEPFTWFTMFENRPGWWGDAEIIEVGQYRYEKVNMTTMDLKRDEEKKAQGIAAAAQGQAPLVVGGDHDDSLDDAMEQEQA